MTKPLGSVMKTVDLNSFFEQTVTVFKKNQQINIIFN